MEHKTGRLLRNIRIVWSLLCKILRMSNGETFEYEILKHENSCRISNSSWHPQNVVLIMNGMQRNSADF